MSPGNRQKRTDLHKHKKQSSTTHTHTHSRFTALCPGLPGWAGTRRNIHPLTPLLLINHPYPYRPVEGLQQSHRAYDRCADYTGNASCLAVITDYCICSIGLRHVQAYILPLQIYSTQKSLKGINWEFQLIMIITQGPQFKTWGPTRRNDMRSSLQF